MNHASQKTKTILAIVILLLSLSNLVFSIKTVWDFTTDDAYISWHYASQLVNGQGLFWHAQMPLVEGYSNFLWVLLSALIIKLELPLETSIKMISCFSLVLALFFLYRLSRLFLNRLLATLPVFIFSYYVGVPWWTVSGMETMFYTCLVILFTWQSCLAFGYKTCEQNTNSEALGVQSTSAWVICNMTLLLLSLTRFEGLVWACPLMCFIYCQWLKNRKLRWAVNQKRTYQWLSLSCLCFLIPYAIYFAWRVYYFGHWIPNSFSCKSITEGQAFVVDFDYLQVIFPLLVVSIPYLLSNRKDCRHVLLWLPSLLYGIMLIEAHPVIAYFSRLFLGSFAVFCLLPVLGLVYFSREYFKEKEIDWVIVLAISFLTWWFVPASETEYLSLKLADYKDRNQSRMAIVNLINKEAKYGDSVYLSDCGIIPYYARSDIRFIDAQCLNNPNLTRSPYKENLPLYAKHLISQEKPNWLIVNYYPEEGHGDYLTDLLFENGFYNHYELLRTFQSGYLIPNSIGPKTKVIDFVYQVYQRKE
ncbi:hypothetical protein [Legionella waltersii]|uniref:Protein LphB n=1 Tax=Legionella waltersii TaxID=66969 RepID=A0A0W1ADC0_9GAMM|nr:hypothetical protein [Legionella waltersii]KTD79288.1 protein LphB [Legionella waltersii]SNV12905.1 protein LphB [Legionella waltersii]